MRWIRLERAFREHVGLCGTAASAVRFFGIILAVATLAVAFQPAPPARLSIFAPNTSFTVKLSDHNGLSYAELGDVMARLCAFEVLDKGKKWKARCLPTEAQKNAQEIELRVQDGKTSAHVGKRELQLPAPALADAGRAHVPVAAMPAILSAAFGTRISLHEASRRLFVGDVATHFTAEAQQDAVVLNFSAPVNPTVSTEPGKVRLTFAREPVVSSAERFSFDSKINPSVAYSEATGTPELVVNANVPLLAAFSNGNKTITLAPAPAAQAAATPPPPAAMPEAAPAPVPAPVAPATRSRVTVLIDPAHGGEERGAMLSSTLGEKDITLALARRLRNELAARGVNAALLRDQDTTLTLEQRAATANATRPWLYLAIHAASSGAGVRLFTPLLPATNSPAGALVLWDRAQQDSLANSRALGDALLARCQQHQLSASLLAAPLRPLNNVQALALGIEVGPPAGAGAVDRLASSSFQQQTAAAIATALAEAQKDLEKQARVPRPGLPLARAGSAPQHQSPLRDKQAARSASAARYSVLGTRYFFSGGAL